MFSKAEVVELSAVDNESLMTNNKTSSIVGDPIGIIEQYKCGVKYIWYAGENADDMSCTDNTMYRRLIGGTYLHECSAVSVYHSTICPCWHNNCASSYNSNLDEYSNTLFIEDFNEAFPGSSGRSRLSTTKYLRRTEVDSIPNEIDQEYFIWEHDGSSTQKIYATVEYNNEMVDVELDIPLVGYKYKTFSVGGQSFVMRCGPRKVSVRANASSDIPLKDFCFAFKAYRL